jgi:hypothetical protein
MLKTFACNQACVVAEDKRAYSAENEGIDPVAYRNDQRNKGQKPNACARHTPEQKEIGHSQDKGD